MADEPSMPVPTAPIMKRGPELFVNASSRSASAAVRALFFLRSVVILAPTDIGRNAEGESEGRAPRH